MLHKLSKLTMLTFEEVVIIICIWVTTPIHTIVLYVHSLIILSKKRTHKRIIVVVVVINKRLIIFETPLHSRNHVSRDLDTKHSTAPQPRI